MPESERIPVLFLFNLYKAPSLALFSCNGCATLRKGPKTERIFHIAKCPFHIKNGDRSPNYATTTVVVLDNSILLRWRCVRYFNNRHVP